MASLSRLQALLLAFFVTVIWSFSWVFIKIGLQDDIPPLLFAGLRYTIAALILLAITLRSSENRQAFMSVSRHNLIRLMILGFFYYTATQGLVFISLSYLSAATFSLLLNFTPIIVTVGGIFLLNEYPNRLQYIGLVLFLLGTVIYFLPTELPALFGLGIGLITMIVNAISSLLGRSINRKHDMTGIQVTVISMSIGSVVLLIIGLLVDGWQPLSLQSWGIIIWLAIVHTAFAFTLWNISLQVLSATESSIINNTMLVQTAILAWVFLGEGLSSRQIIALVIATIGILVFQIRQTQMKDKNSAVS